MKENDFKALSALEEDLLTVLLGRELYGLQIIKVVNEASNGRREISFGSLYPTLHSLEKKGLVKTRWGDEDSESGGGRRKYYQLTNPGEKILRNTQHYRSQLAFWNQL